MVSFRHNNMMKIYKILFISLILTGPDNRRWFSDYGTGELGKLCDDSKLGALDTIKTLPECENAHTILKKYEIYFKDSTFVSTLGNGTDLPFGCISDNTSYQHYVYWNPEGKVISNDPNLRQICKKKSGECLKKMKRW